MVTAWPSISNRRVRILTRGGHDWTDRFPAIAAATRRVPVSTAILDGEAVVLDEQGRSDFGKLQQSLGGRGGNRASREAILMVFDLLYLDGHDFTKTELTARRHLLKGLVPAGVEEAIRLSEEIESDGEVLFRAACEHGLEGITRKLMLSRPTQGWKPRKTQPFGTRLPSQDPAIMHVFGIPCAAGDAIGLKMNIPFDRCKRICMSNLKLHLLAPWSNILNLIHFAMEGRI